MSSVKVSYAKANLSRLIARAEAGEEITITRSDMPVARLLSIALPAKLRIPGRLKGLIDLNERFWEALPEDELGA